MKFFKNKTLLIILLIVMSFSTGFGQTENKNIFPIGTYHTKNVAINGLSVGLWSVTFDTLRNTNTNGLKLELLGIGFFMPLIPSSPISGIRTKGFSGKINGISLSVTGSSCVCLFGKWNFNRWSRAII